MRFTLQTLLREIEDPSAQHLQFDEKMRRLRKLARLAGSANRQSTESFKEAILRLPWHNSLEAHPLLPNLLIQNPKWSNEAAGSAFLFHAWRQHWDTLEWAQLVTDTPETAWLALDWIVELGGSPWRMARLEQDKSVLPEVIASLWWRAISLSPLKVMGARVPCDKIHQDFALGLAACWQQASHAIILRQSRQRVAHLCHWFGVYGIDQHLTEARWQLTRGSLLEELGEIAMAYGQPDPRLHE